MFKRTTTMHALLLAGAALAGGPAQAQDTTVTAGFAGFTYELVDLDPNDSVTPWISFTNAYWKDSQWDAYASADYGQSRPLDYASIETVGTVTQDGPYGRTVAVNGPLGVGSTTTMKAGVQDNVKLASFAEYYAAFTLSPSTRVQFTWIGAIDRPDAPAAAYEVRASLSVNGSLWTSSGTENFAEYLGNGMDRQYDLFHSLSSFTAPASGYLGFNASTSVSHYAAPVPEPHTSAMLAGGLLLLGLQARRARRASP
ncbi:MAG: hypothetical protein ACLGI6_10570 [Gammaproteobacteria bacterium]